MELIPARQINLKYLGDKSRSLKNTHGSQEIRFTINHSLANKTVNIAKIKEKKNAAKALINFVDLNKNNLFTSEIKLLQKYWCLWKTAINIHIASNNAIVKRKAIIFSECDQGIEETKPLKDVYIDKPHYCSNFQGKRDSSEKNVSDRTKKLQIEMDENSLRSSSNIVHSNKIHLNKANQDILHYYWHLWRNNTRTRMPVSQIDLFLSAVLVEKKKIIERYKEKSPAKPVNKGKVIVNHERNETSKGNSSNEILAAKKYLKISTSKKHFSNQIARSISEKNISVSSLQNEVKSSLKRAHSLLETTIVESMRENYAHRKNFSHYRRKGSPIPLEMPYLDILERMKMREMERNIRWQKLKERRKILEEEKSRRILEEEKAALRQMELSKNLKLKQMKEKKLQEKDHKKKLEEWKQKYLEQNLKASNHDRKRLLQMGMKAFWNAFTLKTEQLSHADTYYNRTLLAKKFNEWKYQCLINKERQMSLAVCFHHKILLKSYFHKWMKLQIDLTFNKQAAIDFYEMKVQENVLLCWYRYTCDMMIEENLKLELAEMLYRKSLLKRSLFCWKTLPSVVQAEKARDKIKHILRQKVLEIIPDFLPEIEDD